MDDLLVDQDDPKAQAKQRTLKEMARRSQDRIRVYNPLAEDYTIRFDGIGFVIPNRNKDMGHGNGMAVVFRYVAENYRTQMIDFILTSKMDEAVRLENETRQSKGMLPMTKFVGGEELQFSQTMRTDNEEARRKLIPIIWLGLAERYGVETRSESLSGRAKDDRPMDEILTEQLEKQGGIMPKQAVENIETAASTTPKETLATDPLDDLRNKNVFAIAKIAREKGIETQRTDKKEELLKKISQL